MTAHRIRIEGDPMGQLNSEPIAIPDRVAGCQLTFPSSGRHGSLQYINAACLINAQAPSSAFYAANCDPALGLPAPTCINVDFSLVKNTKVSKISENFAVQFRAEFFNVLNHTNFAPPTDNLEAFDNTGAPVSGFGQITATQVPNREIQFALKFTW
jgi:hypothetical protein